MTETRTRVATLVLAAIIATAGAFAGSATFASSDANAIGYPAEAIWAPTY